VRLNTTRLSAPIVLLSLTAAAACRDGSTDAAANDALQRDLELAQAGAVALAPAARDLPPTRFVSAIEAGERAAPARSAAARPARKAPRRAPTAHVDHAPPTPAPAVTETVAEAAAAEETQVAPAPAPEPTVVADAGPAPAETQTSGPSADGVISVSRPEGEGTAEGEGRRGRGRGIGGILGGIGGVIGVVIRGGSVGDIDHCERDRPGARGGIPYPVGGRMGGIPTSGGWGNGGLGVPQSGIGRVARPRL
jgi:hypothetical protein